MLEMLGKINQQLNKYCKNIHLEIFLVGLVLLLGFFFRVYRIDKLLGFYYDQGRDALVIWDFIHHGKFFLIGPTTGIEGIFRGPWYYWLITSFYFLGKGNPVYPSIFLSFTTIIAVYFLYLLAKEIGGKWAGMVAIIIGAFSYSVVMSSRWLSNPTPMYLISMLFVWSLFRIMDRKKWAWILAAFLIGMAMQFGSAAEVFYIPFFLFFAYINRKMLPGIKIILISLFAFVTVFIPQIIFDIRHDEILSKAIVNFLFSEQSFKLSFWEVLKIRLPFYYETFSPILWGNKNILVGMFLIISLLGVIYRRNIYWCQGKIRSLIVLFLFPLVGMIFFQGNKGNVYSYYFTGYYFIFVLIFSLFLVQIVKYSLGKIIIVLFIVLFLFYNIPPERGYITSGIDGTTIAFGNQMQVVDWIYKDASGTNFNIDVYVPPVISYAYDYLFLWQGTEGCGGNLCGLEEDKLVEKLYTIYEVDPPHPERLEVWLKRQNSIGQVIKEINFGGITIQERKRL